jgi:multisubunit Na+/H+ antiporter MnhG subunit
MVALFSFSAWVVVCWGISEALFLTLWGLQTKSFKTDNLAVVILGSAIIIAIAVSCFVIMIGMAIHCLSSGDFSIGEKILWSIFAFFTGPIAATIYFFAVYKKQSKIHREGAHA